MESGMSGNLVCSVSMFETVTTLPESIHFGTFGQICFLYHSTTVFAPAYWAPSSVRYKKYDRVMIGHAAIYL